jgi:hypothetical protein
VRLEKKMPRGKKYRRRASRATRRLKDAQIELKPYRNIDGVTDNQTMDSVDEMSGSEGAWELDLRCEPRRDPDPQMDTETHWLVVVVVE